MDCISKVTSIRVFGQGCLHREGIWNVRQLDQRKKPLITNLKANRLRPWWCFARCRPSLAECLERVAEDPFL